MRKKNFAPTIYPLDRDTRKAWFVQYYDANGKRQKRYGNLSHFETFTEKMAEAKRIIKEIQEPERNSEKQRNGLVAALDELLEERRPALAKKSYQTYLSLLKCFTAWYRLEYRKDKKINPALYIRHLHVEQYHSNYVRRNKIFLFGMFKTLVKRKLYGENPFEDIHVKKIKGKSKLPFHPNHVAQLLPIIEAEDPQLRDAVDFLFFLFFRPKELTMLKVEHIFFDDMKIAATDDVVKDDDNYLKTVPLPMQQHILKYRGLPADWFIFGKGGQPGTKPLSINHLSNAMTKILRGLNYSKRYTLYSWVHTGIKMAALSGIPIKQLQLQKGHSDLNMFNEYLKDLGVEDCVQLTTNFPALVDKEASVA